MSFSSLSKFLYFQFKMSYSEKDRQISQLSSKVREKEAEASRLRADHQTKIAQVKSISGFCFII